MNPVSEIASYVILTSGSAYLLKYATEAVVGYAMDKASKRIKKKVRDTFFKPVKEEPTEFELINSVDQEERIFVGIPKDETWDMLSPDLEIMHHKERLRKQSTKPIAPSPIYKSTPYTDEYHEKINVPTLIL